MNYERLNKHLSLMQGHKNASARYQAQAFLLLLEQSFYAYDAIEYEVTRLKHDDDEYNLKMKLVFPRVCSFVLRFTGTVVEIVNAKRRYVQLAMGTEVEEKMLGKVIFNQMNEQGAQLHNTLRIVSNVYRVCVQFVSGHSFFDYLIEAYSKFTYPASIWNAPESFTQYEGYNTVNVKYKRGLEEITFSGSSNQLSIVTSKRHCASEISVSTFGLGEDKSDIIDTLRWYMKLSGIVQNITDNERKSTDQVIDFYTGYPYVEPEPVDNLQEGDGL